MRKKILLVLVWLVALASYAQQNTSYRQGGLLSPAVLPNGSVSFQYYAPSADSVWVIGDWEEQNGCGRMIKQPDGVWMYTTCPLKSQMYMYRFEVDGQANIDPINPNSRRDVGNIFSIVYVPGNPGDYFMVQDVPHGTVSQMWYYSNEMKGQRRMSVYLPPSYYTNPGKNYPVLYLLHGSGGDENAWLDLGMLSRVMDNLIAKGESQEMLVVMPNGTMSKPAAAGETPENMDFRPLMTHLLPDYKNGRYEMSFPEIVSTVDERFRTLADREHRAVAGLSMGGMHTLYIALNHPDMFSWYGLFSAGLTQNLEDNACPAYQQVDKKFQGLTEAGYHLLWIACGKDDFLYDVNQYFIHFLQLRSIPFEYHESTRGHLWVNWRDYLLQFTRRLFK